MIIFCGYNGFQQFLAFCPNGRNNLKEHVLSEFNYLSTHSEDIILSATWSEILFVDSNNIKVYGFFNNESGRCMSLVPPFKDKILQATISKDGFMFVCDSGNLWLYSRKENLWKDITNFFCAELISEFQPGKITKVSCGETLTAAITNTGMAYCGLNYFSEVKGVKDVVCGKEHGILLTGDGSVYTWGGGSRGQLGKGDLENSESPCEVEALSGLEVVRIAAGGWHSAALTRDGDLYTWGWNKQGQLGFPVLSDGVEGGVSVQVVPRVVELPDDDAVVEDVSCGASHTVIKLSDGSVYGCGWNKWGQLGLGQVKRAESMRLLPVPPGSSVQRVLCGSWSTFILSS